MPPLRDSSSSIGWKFFFGLLMVMQTIAIGVMWRTYDAVTTNSRRQDVCEVRLDQIVMPRLENVERRVFGQASSSIKP